MSQRSLNWVPRYTLRPFPIPDTEYWIFDWHERYLGKPPIPIKDGNPYYDYDPQEYANKLYEQEKELMQLNIRGPNLLPSDYDGSVEYDSTTNKLQKKRHSPVIVLPRIVKTKFVMYDTFKRGMRIGDPPTDRLPMRQIMYGMTTGKGILDRERLEIKQEVQFPDFLPFQDEDDPSWLDLTAVKRGQAAYLRNFLPVFLGLMTVLIRGFLDRRLSDVLSLSGEALTEYKTFMRYSATGNHLRMWLSENNLTNPYSQGRNSLRQVRVLHTHARLRAKPYYEAEARREALLRYRSQRAFGSNHIRSYEEIEEECLTTIGVPLSQADLAIVQLAFSGLAIVLAEREFSCVLTTQDAHDICHMWRYFGFRLGITDEFNMCRSYQHMLQASNELIPMLNVFECNKRIAHLKIDSLRHILEKTRRRLTSLSHNTSSGPAPFDRAVPVAHRASPAYGGEYGGADVAHGHPPNSLGPQPLSDKRPSQTTTQHPFSLIHVENLLQLCTDTEEELEKVTSSFGSDDVHSPHSSSSHHHPGLTPQSFSSSTSDFLRSGNSPNTQYGGGIGNRPFSGGIANTMPMMNAIDASSPSTVSLLVHPTAPTTRFLCKTTTNSFGNYYPIGQDNFSGFLAFGLEEAAFLDCSYIGFKDLDLLNRRNGIQNPLVSNPTMHLGCSCDQPYSTVSSPSDPTACVCGSDLYLLTSVLVEYARLYHKIIDFAFTYLDNFLTIEKSSQEARSPAAPQANEPIPPKVKQLDDILRVLTYHDRVAYQTLGESGIIVFKYALIACKVVSVLDCSSILNECHQLINQHYNALDKDHKSPLSSIESHTQGSLFASGIIFKIATIVALQTVSPCEHQHDIDCLLKQWTMVKNPHDVMRLGRSPGVNQRCPFQPQHARKFRPLAFNSTLKMPTLSLCPALNNSSNLANSLLIFSRIFTAKSMVSFLNTLVNVIQQPISMLTLLRPKSPANTTQSTCPVSSSQPPDSVSQQFHLSNAQLALEQLNLFLLHFGIPLQCNVVWLPREHRPAASPLIHRRSSMAHIYNTSPTQPDQVHVTNHDPLPGGSPDYMGQQVLNANAAANWDHLLTPVMFPALTFIPTLAHNCTPSDIQEIAQQARASIQQRSIGAHGVTPRPRRGGQNDIGYSSPDRFPSSNNAQSQSINMSTQFSSASLLPASSVRRLTHYLLSPYDDEDDVDRTLLNTTASLLSPERRSSLDPTKLRTSLVASRYYSKGEDLVFRSGLRDSLHTGALDKDLYSNTDSSLNTLPYDMKQMMIDTMVLPVLSHEVGEDNYVNAHFGKMSYRSHSLLPRLFRDQSMIMDYLGEFGRPEASTKNSSMLLASTTISNVNQRIGQLTDYALQFYEYWFDIFRSSYRKAKRNRLEGQVSMTSNPDGGEGPPSRYQYHQQIGLTSVQSAINASRTTPGMANVASPKPSNPHDLPILMSSRRTKRFSLSRVIKQFTQQIQLLYDSAIDVYEQRIETVLQAYTKAPSYLKRGKRGARVRRQRMTQSHIGSHQHPSSHYHRWFTELFKIAKHYRPPNPSRPPVMISPASFLQHESSTRYLKNSDGNAGDKARHSPMTQGPWQPFLSTPSNSTSLVPSAHTANGLPLFPLNVTPENASSSPRQREIQGSSSVQVRGRKASFSLEGHQRHLKRQLSKTPRHSHVSGFSSFNNGSNSFTPLSLPASTSNKHVVMARRGSLGVIFHSGMSNKSNNSPDVNRGRVNAHPMDDYLDYSEAPSEDIPTLESLQNGSALKYQQELSISTSPLSSSQSPLSMVGRNTQTKFNVSQRESFQGSGLLPIHLSAKPSDNARAELGDINSPNASPQHVTFHQHDTPSLVSDELVTPGITLPLPLEENGHYADTDRCTSAAISHLELVSLTCSHHGENHTGSDSGSPRMARYSPTHIRPRPSFTLSTSTPRETLYGDGDLYIPCQAKHESGSAIEDSESVEGLDIDDDSTLSSYSSNSFSDLQSNPFSSKDDLATSSPDFPSPPSSITSDESHLLSETSQTSSPRHEDPHEAEHERSISNILPSPVKHVVSLPPPTPVSEARPTPIPDGRPSSANPKPFINLSVDPTLTSCYDETKSGSPVDTKPHQEHLHDADDDDDDAIIASELHDYITTPPLPTNVPTSYGADPHSSSVMTASYEPSVAADTDYFAPSLSRARRPSLAMSTASCKTLLNLDIENDAVIANHILSFGESFNTLVLRDLYGQLLSSLQGTGIGGFGYRLFNEIELIAYHRMSQKTDTPNLRPNHEFMDHITDDEAYSESPTTSTDPQDSVPPFFINTDPQYVHPVKPQVNLKTRKYLNQPGAYFLRSLPFELDILACFSHANNPLRDSYTATMHPFQYFAFISSLSSAFELNDQFNGLLLSRSFLSPYLYANRLLSNKLNVIAALQDRPGYETMELIDILLKEDFQSYNHPYSFRCFADANTGFNTLMGSDSLLLKTRSRSLGAFDSEMHINNSASLLLPQSEEFYQGVLRPLAVIMANTDQTNTAIVDGLTIKCETNPTFNDLDLSSFLTPSSSDRANCEDIYLHAKLTDGYVEQYLSSEYYNVYAYFLLTVLHYRPFVDPTIYLTITPLHYYHLKPKKLQHEPHLNSTLAVIELPQTTPILLPYDQSVARHFKPYQEDRLFWLQHDLDSLGVIQNATVTLYHRYAKAIQDVPFVPPHLRFGVLSNEYQLLISSMLFDLANFRFTSYTALKYLYNIMLESSAFSQLVPRGINKTKSDTVESFNTNDNPPIGYSDDGGDDENGDVFLRPLHVTDDIPMNRPPSPMFDASRPSLISPIFPVRDRRLSIVSMASAGSVQDYSTEDVFDQDYHLHKDLLHQVYTSHQSHGYSDHIYNSPMGNFHDTNASLTPPSLLHQTSKAGHSQKTTTVQSIHHYQQQGKLGLVHFSLLLVAVLLFIIFILPTSRIVHSIVYLANPFETSFMLYVILIALLIQKYAPHFLKPLG